jgi:hypothetical protein
MQVSVFCSREAMKKNLILLQLVLVLAAGVISSCSQKDSPAKTAAQNSSTALETGPAKGTGLILKNQDAVRINIEAVEKLGSFDAAQWRRIDRYIHPQYAKLAVSPDGQKAVTRELTPQGYFLVLADANGTNKKLLKECQNGFQPVWSPDSNKILFSAYDWKTYKRNIYVYDIRSEQKRLVFEAIRKIGGLSSWSPDGSKIVFTYFGELWMVNSTGIGKKMLNLRTRIQKEVDEAELFAWTADGSKLLYQPRNVSEFFLMTLAPGF